MTKPNKWTCPDNPKCLNWDKKICKHLKEIIPEELAKSEETTHRDVGKVYLGSERHLDDLNFEASSGIRNHEGKWAQVDVVPDDDFEYEESPDSTSNKYLRSCGCTPIEIEIIQAKHRDGKIWLEIAKATGKSESTVKRIHTEAIKKLRRKENTNDDAD